MQVKSLLRSILVILVGTFAIFSSAAVLLADKSHGRRFDQRIWRLCVNSSERYEMLADLLASYPLTSMERRDLAVLLGPPDYVRRGLLSWELGCDDSILFISVANEKVVNVTVGTKQDL